MSTPQSQPNQKFAGIPIKPYSHAFALDRLQLGIDNLRYDLHLSPGFVKAAHQMAVQLLAKYSDLKDLPGIENDFNWYRGEKEFKGLCREIMLDAVKRAKHDEESQVLYLAMAAIAATLRDAVGDRYRACLQHVNNQIWRHEMAYNHDSVVDLQEALQVLTRGREGIIRNANARLFELLQEVLAEHINAMQDLHFGAQGILPDDFFANPLLHAENPASESFLMAEYVLMGSRREDLNQYETILSALDEFLQGFGQLPVATDDADAAAEGASATGAPPGAAAPQLSDWIKAEGNIDALFNYLRTQQMLRRDRRKSGEKERLRKLKQLARRQHMLLGRLLKDFHRRGLARIVMATSAITTFSHDYCPPLTPHEVLQYIVDPKSRTPIKAKLKRIKQKYGEDYTLQPFRNCLTQIRWLSRLRKMEILLDFVRSFGRYHRDLCNFQALTRAIQYINFVSDENLLKLSRANHSLYEFLLPSEQVLDQKPIISHTVIKADVRGSTGIVAEMKAKGLNPATNFSLNFFDPITAILSRYGAVKVFIEGDAIILAIFEYENEPHNWYSVARACGLAMNILLIVHRYNRKNRENHLPQLEFGIGVSYSGSAPTFFFDADNQIMISPAINLADRLSSCFKPLRKLNPKQNSPFNLFVYEVAAEDRESSAEAQIRYNVNGIELSADGFEKLKREIQLEKIPLRLSGDDAGRQRLYRGKYPSASGALHQIVVREAALPTIALNDLQIKGWTDRFYYEVCTDPGLLKRLVDGS
jgi:hypothetical protein